MIKYLILFLFSQMLIACGGGSSTNSASVDEDINLTLDFKNNTNAWKTGFADYPVADEALYILTSAIQPLPAPLTNQTGLFLSGVNRSDDLFMFTTKRFSGFEANTQYNIRFKLIIATNAPKGCVGVGGSPGEGVTIKAGASVIEPIPINSGTGFFVMNIDKGNQTVSGTDAISIGDFSNSKDCASNEFSYELKTLTSGSNLFSAFTDSSGTLWVMFATDSGFESTTSIYFISGKITATKI